jgi:uncharacterized Zn-finger protein
MVESTVRIAIIRPVPILEDFAAMPDTAEIPTPTEIIHVDHPVLACDGGGGVLGHPRVFLHIEDRSILCPYCSRLFILNEGAGHAAGH